jgi:hypothetical protein
MHQAGGRITVTLGGQRYSPRGKAMLFPAGLQHAANVNHDGTVSRSTMAQSVRAELTFDRGAASSGFARPKWDSAFMLEFINVTIAETDAGVVHHFTNATMIGEPSIDTETGEISGLSIACAAGNYTQAAL